MYLKTRTSELKTRYKRDLFYVHLPFLGVLAEVVDVAYLLRKFELAPFYSQVYKKILVVRVNLYLCEIPL